MGLFGRLKGMFARNDDYYEEEYVPEWDETTLKRDDVDMHDKTQRENYVTACLEQISEAANELDKLGGEYNLVTAYLKDMEHMRLR